MNNRIAICDENLGEIFSSKGLLFDTNVWLRVQGYFTDSSDQRSRTYSWLYKKALEGDHPIFLPQVVVSEYVKVSLNAMAKDSGWDSKGKIHAQPNYNEWISEVSDAVFHVAQDAVRLDDEFSTLNIDQCLNECCTSSIDFNDVLIAGFCKRHNLMLVTDDADMKDQKVPLATANKKLLGK